jgi:glycosyltransferase involved in cell wall biosynthesis
VKTFACHAAYGNGGLGRHLAELVEDARGAGRLDAYYTSDPKPGDPAGRVVQERLSTTLSRWTPVRFSPGRRANLAFGLFDRAVARVVEPAETHVGFSLQSLRTFQAAKKHGSRRLELVSPTCHIDHVRRRYQEAYERHPIERSWLDDGQCRRAVHEYELADMIVIASDYVRDSFLDAGYPEDRLVRFDLSAAARFAPRARSSDGIFRLVYVGALSVAKGTPVLVEAFARFAPSNAELWLVGGWGTRGMRLWLSERCKADSRIRIAPGDPLPHLQRADLYVHPSYQDGSPYAPLEALACGVPVVVTEDTGTKELIRDGLTGRVIPTGSSDAILEAIREAYESVSSEVHGDGAVARTRPVSRAHRG